MDDEEPILYRAEDGVARITINRPRVLNAMDSFAHLAFSQALDAASDDASVRVVVVAGAGDRAFSVGRDLGEMSDAQEMDQAGRAALDERWAKTRRLTDRHDFWKPIVASVQGYALGGGFEIAMACDLIIASDDAVFGLPEPKRGLVAFAGGMHRLPRQIPSRVAMGYLLTGRNIGAARAYELGLVNEVAPRADLATVVEGWVSDILACGPLSVQATKQCAMRGLGRPLDEATATTYLLFETWRTSSDAKEGPRAFAEKRKPVWTGT
jgi:enoyl-CoA hydratase/carnithine racemase